MQQPEVGQRQLPAYKSHKTVRALKIACIEQTPADEPAAVAGGTWRLIPEDKSYDPITVPHSYVLKHNPQPGGYYVLYADGYASFSPEHAFEEGYTAIVEECFTAIGPEEHRRNWVGDPPAGGFENYVKNHGQPLRAHVTASSGERDTEQAIKAASADRAPRITPDDIEANIAGEFYFTAAEGVLGAINKPSDPMPKIPLPLGLLTFCVLVLRNGFTVTGQSACASPENFNAEIGRRIAREDAVRQVWPLLGFRLRDKLAATPADFRDRVRAEKQDLDEKIARLSAFFVTKQFGALSFVEQANLHTQHVAMTTYSDILGQRIAAFGQGQPG